MRRILALALLLALSWRPALAGPAVGPATVLRPARDLDTYVITGGRAAGYVVGDRVRVTRSGRAIGTGVVVRVGPSSAEVLLESGAGGRLRPGDGITFVRRRKPLPKEAPPAASVPRPAPPGASAAADFYPTDWKEAGAVKGLSGDDWWTRNTRTCIVYCRQGDLPYVKTIADTLDDSAAANEQFLGLPPPVPMKAYFFSLQSPAHTQQLFHDRLAGKTRFAGIALYGTNSFLINMGDWRTARLYDVYDIEATCRHEMDHVFTFPVEGTDRMNTWSWFCEALAHTIEDTSKPPSAQITLADLKSYMAGYHDRDTSLTSMIGDRNSDDLEQYRDYDKLLISVIFFMREKYGKDCIPRIMQAARGQDIEDAFIQVCGKGEKGIEADWKAYYGMR